MCTIIRFFGELRYIWEIITLIYTITYFIHTNIFISAEDKKLCNFIQRAIIYLLLLIFHSNRILITESKKMDDINNLRGKEWKKNLSPKYIGR